MYKFLKILSTLTILINFVACTPATFENIKTPIAIQSKIKIVKPKDKTNKIVWIKNRDSTLKDTLQIKYKKIAETFYVASIYGKRHGYSYFALSSKKMNNLNGYPINDFDNLIRYCDFEKKSAKKHYKPNQVCWAEDKSGLFDLYSVNLAVQYFKQPISGLFLYSIDDTIEKTKKYIQ